MLVTPSVYGASVISRRAGPGDVLALGGNLSAGALATVGDGTWTGALIATGIIRRTGPTGDYSDTTDTAANILTALAGNGWAAEVVAGQSFRLLVQNTVAYVATLVAGTGVTLGTGTTTIAASLVREYILSVLNASPPLTLNCNTTNSSATVTFNLPTGMVALPIGPSPLADNVTTGMIVSGTGITAGTTVIGVTQGVGGITGVTLSANATATSSGGVSLTFGPNIRIDSLRSSTL